MTATLEEIKKAVEHGVLYNLQVSAPAKGEYYFRIAVHDLNRDHYGVVEMALADVKNLTLPPIPAAAPAGK